MQGAADGEAVGSGVGEAALEGVVTTVGEGEVEGVSLAVGLSGDAVAADATGVRLAAELESGGVVHADARKSRQIVNPVLRVRPAIGELSRATPALAR